MIDSKALLAAVRTNHAALDRCAGPHRFEPIGEMRLGMRWRCQLCGGTVDAIALSWYRRGVVHGGGDPAAVTSVPSGAPAGR